jgi:thioredoxin-dependent peroxiredoxin
MAPSKRTDIDFVPYQAPEFSAPTTSDTNLGLSDLKGQWTVLYFYPKDDTTSCTQEAKDFTAALPEFDALGARVIGVSKDTLKSHDKFRAKYDLKHTLIADEDGKVVEAFGVWIEKSMYGRQYMGIERATFLIDPEGMVRHAWHGVRVKEHAAGVLGLLRTLIGQGVSA